MNRSYFKRVHKFFRFFFQLKWAHLLTAANNEHTLFIHSRDIWHFDNRLFLEKILLRWESVCFPHRSYQTIVYQRQCVYNHIWNIFFPQNFLQTKFNFFVAVSNMILTSSQCWMEEFTFIKSMSGKKIFLNVNIFRYIC